MRDESDEAEDQPLVRHQINPSSTSADTGKEIDYTKPSNSQHNNTSSQQNRSDSHMNEVFPIFFCQIRSVQKKEYPIVTIIYSI